MHNFQVPSSKLHQHELRSSLGYVALRAHIFQYIMQLLSKVLLRLLVELLIKALDGVVKQIVIYIWDVALNR